MKLEEYIVVDGKKMRCGYTTGSCALGAVTACCEMLRSGKVLEQVHIGTPAGIELHLDVLDAKVSEHEASCAIQKDAGDDPDVTDKTLIYARVRRREDGEITLDGGKGIGRIAREGLFGAVGEAAINPTPKRLILETIESANLGGLDALIWAPDGERLAKKTFNAGIGIEGGISIIGTRGIVYPMSEEALLKSIYLEMDMAKQRYGTGRLILTPGNYGERMCQRQGIEGPVIKVSNFLGQALKYAYSLGFRSFLLLGHVGKFAKLSLGIFQTHSNTADTRMEAFVYHLALMGAPLKLLQEVDALPTAEKALLYCEEHGFGDVLSRMEEASNRKVRYYLKDETLDVKTVIYRMVEEEK